MLLGLASKKVIWSIDPHTGGLAYIARDEDQNSFDDFLRNIERAGISNRVQALRNTVQEVVNQALVPDTTKFSLVFIDGLHTPEGVEVDFGFSYDRLVGLGIMVFDDYFEPSVRDYSYRIDQLVKKNNLGLVKHEKSGLVYVIKEQCM